MNAEVQGRKENEGFVINLFLKNWQCFGTSGDLTAHLHLQIREIQYPSSNQVKRTVQ